MKKFLALIGLLACLGARAAEVIPPAPALYFNDYAHVISPGTATRLNQQLEDFERQTSSQIVVAIFPKLETDSAMEDYTVRVFRAWKVGQQQTNNGAVLFIFVQDHKMRIEVGYGLEGVLPDALCKRILDDEITPHFKAGDFDGGLSAGVTALMAAAKGEYRGTGRTVADRTQGSSNQSNGLSLGFWIVIVIFIILFIFSRMSSGRRGYGGSGWWIGGGGFGGGWGGGGGGGWSGGGGGGGFSGGGGSGGGGGASGSW